MNTDNLEPIARMVMREVALGLNDTDIAVNHPELTELAISRMRAGATFKRGLAEMQKRIDEELVAHAAEDPVRQYMQSKGFSMATTLVTIAEDVEEQASVRVKAADSVLSKTGYSGTQDTTSVPVLMLSTEKLNAVLSRDEVLKDIPDCVDGHNE